MPDTYSVPECKEMLGVGDDELRELVRTGQIHVIRQDNQIRIKADDVDRMAESANAPRDAFSFADDDKPAADQDTEEPLALVSEQEMDKGEPSQHEIRSFGGPGSIGRSDQAEAHLTRALIQHGGATRCRVFHAKLNDGAIAYMENQVNEWADANPELVIKFMNTCIGVFEGKHSEPHLIVTVFY